jgi:hypothetical protein
MWVRKTYTIGLMCFLVFLSAICFLTDSYAVVSQAGKASVKAAQKFIELINGVKKTKKGYVFVDKAGKILAPIEGREDFELVKQIARQIEVPSERLIFMAVNAKQISRISPTIQGFVEREAKSLTKIETFDDVLMALSSNNPIEATTARRLLGRVNDVHKIPGVSIEKLDFIPSVDIENTTAGFWASLTGQKRYCQVALKASDTGDKELERMVLSLSKKSKEDGIPCILFYGERKPSESVIKLAEKEKIQILYGNSKGMEKGFLASTGDSAKMALGKTTAVGKKEFYPDAMVDLQDAGFKVIPEENLVRIGRSWRSRPDFIAERNNRLGIGEIKSPKEPPTSSSWRSPQKSDTAEFKEVRKKVADMERHGKIETEEGGWMIIIKGQVDDYARKIGKTYDLPPNISKEGKELYGILQVPVEQKDNVIKAFKRLKAEKMLNVNIADVEKEIIEKRNTVIFQWPLSL